MREMKDSGVEWIGEIPKDWVVTKLNRAVGVITDYVASGSFADLAENVTYLDTPDYAMLIRIADLSGTKDKPVYIDKKAYDFLSNSNLFGGEVILSNIGSVGSVYIYHKMYEYASLAPNSIMLNKSDDNRFVYYWFMNPMANDELKRIGGNAVQAKFNKTQLRQFKIALPPSEEQHRIADYLDEKCSQIDAFIAKQQQIIEKLSAYKQSIITETVTKGLNPNAELKDSEIQFLGKVPSHWDIIKFGKCMTIKSNLVSPEQYYDYPQIAPDCIEKNSGKLLSYKTVHDSGVTSWNHLFFEGQIIYSKIRPLLNKVIIAPFDGLCSADMYPIETTNIKQFIVYLILSEYFSAQVALVTANRVKMPKINQNELSNIFIALPPVEEQSSISDYLQKKCKVIDQSIDKRQLIIDKLVDYKKSLIYEIVTGKREL